MDLRPLDLLMLERAGVDQFQIGLAKTHGEGFEKGQRKLVVRFQDVQELLSVNDFRFHAGFRDCAGGVWRVLERRHFSNDISSGKACDDLLVLSAASHNRDGAGFYEENELAFIALFKNRFSGSE